MLGHTTRRTIHVLSIIDGLGWGGAEMLLPEFARAARLADIDVSVAYLREKHGSPAASRLREVGVVPVGLDVGGLLNPSSLRAVHRHIASVRPDLVHTHLGYSDLLGGVAAGALAVPSISTIHLTRWKTTLRERIKLELFDLARRGTAGSVVAVSDAVRAAYLRQGWGPSDRVVTIHNCISDGAQPGAGRRVRAELGIAPDDPVVGMVSVLRQGKGHECAAAAIELVRKRVPGTRLVVVGEGPFRPEVEAALAPLGPAAILTGHRDDVMAILDSFDVFLLPSEHEAFPTALLEAMAAGVPIVASAVGGVPEIVVDGVTGRLVRPPLAPERLAAVLTELLLSPAERARTGAAGRERFERRFSHERWAEQLRSLYERVIAERRAPCQRLAERIRSPLPARGRADLYGESGEYS